MTEKSLYERLGGVFAIAAVIDHFSDAVVKNPIVGKTSKNSALREWHTKSLEVMKEAVPLFERPLVAGAPTSAVQCLPLDAHRSNPRTPSDPTSVMIRYISATMLYVSNDRNVRALSSWPL
jgi:hypothetical protein